MASGFGGRLRELRLAADLTQAVLAELSGMAKDTVARIERGEHEPTWPTIQSLCLALDTTCDAFNSPPAPRDAATGPGRPSKQQEEKPKRPRGRPKKAQ